MSGSTMRPVDPNPAVFALQEYWQYQHPQNQNYAVMWQGPFLDIVLPFEGFARFELATFPVRTWVSLQDQAGQRIPIAVYIDYGILTGMWLSFGDEVPRQQLEIDRARQQTQGQPARNQQRAEHHTEEALGRQTSAHDAANQAETHDASGIPSLLQRVAEEVVKLQDTPPPAPPDQGGRVPPSSAADQGDSPTGDDA